MKSFFFSGRRRDTRYWRDWSSAVCSSDLETSTMAPMVFGDKVLVGISGGEYGVRGHVTAYNINNGSQVWRAYSVGTDEDIKFDPQKTTHMGQPVGANSSISSWQDRKSVV